MDVVDLFIKRSDILFHEQNKSTQFLKDTISIDVFYDAAWNNEYESLIPLKFLRNRLFREILEEN
jgi:hypothetical protein